MVNPTFIVEVSGDDFTRLDSEIQTVEAYYLTKRKITDSNFGSMGEVQTEVQVSGILTVRGVNASDITDVKQLGNNITFAERCISFSPTKIRLANNN